MDGCLQVCGLQMKNMTSWLKNLVHRKLKVAKDPGRAPEFRSEHQRSAVATARCPVGETAGPKMDAEKFLKKADTAKPGFDNRIVIPTTTSSTRISSVLHISPSLPPCFREVGKVAVVYLAISQVTQLASITTRSCTLPQTSLDHTSPGVPWSRPCCNSDQLIHSPAPSWSTSRLQLR